VFIEYRIARRVQNSAMRIVSLSVSLVLDRRKKDERGHYEQDNSATITATFLCYLIPLTMYSALEARV
jgi:hypothetical protein